MQKVTIRGFDKEQDLFEIMLEDGEKISVSQRKLIFHPDEGKTYLVRDPEDPASRYFSAKILSAKAVDPSDKTKHSYANSIDIQLQWTDYSNEIKTINIRQLSQLLCINVAQANNMGLRSKKVKLIKDPSKEGQGFYLGRFQI